MANKGAKIGPEAMPAKATWLFWQQKRQRSRKQGALKKSAK